MVSSEILNAHKDIIATRVLHRVIRSTVIRLPRTVPLSLLPVGDCVINFFDTTKNEPTEWVPGIITGLEDHFALVRRTVRAQHGRPMRIAFEDFRLCPKSALAEELSQWTVGNYLTE